jgi:hypothetical protein
MANTYIKYVRSAKRLIETTFFRILRTYFSWPYYPNQDQKNNTRDFTVFSGLDNTKISTTRRYMKSRGALWLAYGSCLGFVGLEMNENGSMEHEN